MAFIEETIVLKDVKAEEISKYYIQENFSETDRITYIMKKGYACQKENLLKNIPFIFFNDFPNNTSLIASTVSSIMENIELSDKNIQILFAKCLNELGNKIALYITSYKAIAMKIKNELINEFNVIVKNFFVCIATLEKAVSDEYIENLCQFIEKCQECKFRIKINKEIIDYASSLGKFGQNVTNRKISIFFCACLIQISSERENDIYKRLEFLFDDSERLIRFELAYQSRFIIKESEVSYCNTKLVSLMTSLLEESDLTLKSIAIESILHNDNYNKFASDSSNNNMLNIAIRSIEEAFNISDFYALTNDFNCLVNIFLSVIDSAIRCDFNRKKLIDVIRKFLRKFFYINEMKNSTNVTLTFRIDYALQKFDKICMIAYKEGDIGFLKEILTIAMKYYFSSNENVKFLYPLLFSIVQYLPKDFMTKLFFQKVFFFFETETYTPPEIENCPPINFDETFLMNIDKISNEMIKIENDEYVQFIISKMQNIIPLLVKTKNWRSQSCLISFFFPLPSYLVLNYIKYPLYEDTLDILSMFCKDFLSKERNILIEKDITRLLALIAQSSTKQRDDILSIMSENFLLNQSFYKKRVYLLFADALLNIMSYKFCKDNNIINNLTNTLLLNEVPIMQCLVIKALMNRGIYSEDIGDIVNKVLCQNLSEKIDTELISTGKLYTQKLKENSNEKVKAQFEEIEKSKVESEQKILDIEKMIIESSKKDDIVIKKSRTKQIRSNGSAYKSTKNRKSSANLSTTGHAIPIAHDNTTYSNTVKQKKHTLCFIKGKAVPPVSSTFAKSSHATNKK